MKKNLKGIRVVGVTESRMSVLGGIFPAVNSEGLALSGLLALDDVSTAEVRATMLCAAVFCDG